jgi:serine/threonine protein kinase
MSHNLFAPGHTVGAYILEAYLATGSFGDLYKARHSTTQERVVLKMVNVPFGTRVGIDVFALGNQLLTLSHPCLVPVREIHLDDVPQYIVMAYAPGGSLAQSVKSTSTSPQLKVEEALTIISQVGKALSYLHGQSIVHRGVQPASVLFSLHGVQLSGLDLACRVEQLADARRIVTVAYAAPEEIQGMVSPQSDQYALGSLAYHLLTGMQPSTHMRRHLVQCISGQTIPAHMGRTLLRALAELPSSRWPSVADFVATLTAPQL